jgi:hypothetical protein
MESGGKLVSYSLRFTTGSLKGSTPAILKTLRPYYWPSPDY